MRWKNYREPFPFVKDKDLPVTPRAGSEVSRRSLDPASAGAPFGRTLERSEEALHARRAGPVYVLPSAQAFRESRDERPTADVRLAQIDLLRAAPYLDGAEPH